MAVSVGSQRTVSRALILRALALLVLALLAGGDGLSKGTSAEGSSVFTVTKQQDTADSACDADCSLREAIIAAGSADGPSTIVVPARATPYLITNGIGDDTGLSGDFDILTPITIEGAGIDQTIIDGNAQDTVFNVLPGGDLTLSNLTVRNGNGTQGSGVGGIYAQGSLTLLSSNVTGNVGGPGGAGGIDATAEVTILDSFISDNHSEGSGTGGIRSTFETHISNTTIAANEASGTGSVGGLYMEDDGDLTNVTISGNSTNGESSTGGLYTRFNTATNLTRVKILDNSASGNYAVGGWWNNATVKASDVVIDGNQGGTYGEGGLFIECCNGKLELSRATVSDNTAPSDSGGGIWNSGESTLTNVTVSGNSAGSLGIGGVYNDSSLTLDSVTIVANSAGAGGAGGFWNDDMASARNTIISGNVVANCHEGTAVASEGGNLSDDSGCGFTDALDHPGTQPMLDTLGDNGGFSMTHALLPQSPAIDAGVGCPPPDTDQRGVARPQGPACDSGAYEVAQVVTVHGFWGDILCDGSVGAEDAVAMLGKAVFGDAGEPADPNCPTPDESVLVGDQSVARRWGDVNCDGVANVLDGLWILRHLAQIPLPKPLGCPDIGALY